MSALTADFNRIHKEGKILDVPVAASTTIYKGAMVGVVKGTGYLVPLANTANMVLLGMALQNVDNSAGSNGDLNCQVLLRGVVELTIASVAEADRGKFVYASDDTTGTLTLTTNAVIVGRVLGYKTTNTAWVFFDGTLLDVEQAEARYRTLQVRIPDISTADDVPIVSPYAGTIEKIYSIIDGAITIADAALSFEIGGTAITGGGITITQSGSAALDVDSSTPTALNILAAGDSLEAITDGGSTDACVAEILFLIRLS